MKKLLIIVMIGTLFVGCSNKKEDETKQVKKSNAPIIGDEKQVGDW
jgi:uncharacterized protein YcfL